MSRSFACPHCGEPVAAGRLACPHCGSDAASGWNEDAEGEGYADSVEMDDGDYQEFLQREFPDQLTARQRVRTHRWKLVLGLLLLAFLLWVLQGW